MARFNQPAAPATITNMAGGNAYAQSKELELISVLLTSFANDQFYRSSTDAFDQLKKLIMDCDKLFAAKAAVYARTVFGMRSISHVAASYLASRVSGESWAKDFYRAIIHRPDDMMEIIALHKGSGHKLTNAMKRGFGHAFEKFDAYHLSKYKAGSKDYKLVDIVNLVHPRPVEKNKEALSSLIKGTIGAADTWETALTQAGQAAENEEQKQELKKEAWEVLIKEKKIGYFALLRNLRNIIEQAPEMLPEALALLTDEKRIKKSLVLPFRYTTAYEEILKLQDGPRARITIIGLNKALDIAVSNVPVFDGDTLVVLDVSLSMKGRPSQIGSLFAAVLTKSNNADLMTFDTSARYININPLDSTTTIISHPGLRSTGGGTDFHSIFRTINKAYRRIIILSDMQGWVGLHTPVADFNHYKKMTGADPYIYSFDLNGYGSMQFPQRHVFALAGFSEKVFDIMKLMEQDKNALMKEINNISFT